MGELKTKRTNASVDAFLKRVRDVGRREDCFTLLRLMKQVIEAEPRMWGASIVGLGGYHYTYRSGREGEWPLTGFSPRKQYLTVYILDGFDGYGKLLSRLGKHKTGKCCLYIKRLADVDLAVLKKMVAASVKHMKGVHGK